MSFNHSRSCVAIGLLAIFLASPAFGQGPLGFQIFAPADVSTYGGSIEPNEGYFFQFDGLYWNISTPKSSPVGYPGTRDVWYGIHPTGPGDTLNDVKTQSNTLDTSVIDDQFSVGNRFEIGRIEDRNGWFVSIYQLRDQTQTTSIPTADMVFNDPPFGPLGSTLLSGVVGTSGGSPVIKDLPVTFYDLTVTQKTNTWGVELMYLHRNLTRHAGGTFEWFMGARYLEFNDVFGVQTGTGGTTTVPSFLAQSSWESSAENHVIGPEVGIRWFKKRGRWMLSTEGRFMAGLNCQNIHQVANIGPLLNPSGSATTTNFVPTLMSPGTATHDAFAREWAPGVELRIEGRYQITRAISFHAGWAGIWMDGIARGSNVINYTVPNMGIDLSRNRESLFMNGLTLGFDVNR